MDEKSRELLYKFISALEQIFSLYAIKNGATISTTDADFEENEHPRKKDGKFAAKGQGEHTAQKSFSRKERSNSETGNNGSISVKGFEPAWDAMKKSGYKYFGVRIGEPHSIGALLPKSHNIEFGDYVKGKLLDGTSATGFLFLPSDEEGTKESLKKAIKGNSSYRERNSDMQYIIGGNSAEEGNDEGEQIIKDAHVIAIIENGNIRTKNIRGKKEAIGEQQRYKMPPLSQIPKPQVDPEFPKAQEYQMNKKIEALKSIENIEKLPAGISPGDVKEIAKWIEQETAGSVLSNYHLEEIGKQIEKNRLPVWAEKAIKNKNSGAKSSAKHLYEL